MGGIKVSANKRHVRLRKIFGVDEYGFPDIPKRISNVLIARIIHHEERGGCSICFPHGIDTTNATWKKNRQSWKNHRRTQYHG